MRVAVLDDYQDVAERMADWSGLGPAVETVFFHAHHDRVEDLIRIFASFDCLVIMRERTPFPRAVFEGLPKLRLLVTSGLKNVAIDMQAATQHGVQVCGTETLAHPTVELTWALILALARNIPREMKAMRMGNWQVSLGSDLRGRTLGIIGLGRLGGQVAQIAKAFGMDVLAWSPNLTQERAAEFGANRVEKSELLTRSDYVSLHLAFSASSENLIDAGAFGLMKPTAFLINTSRSGIIDEPALIEALRTRRIGGAGLDVLPQEPLPPDHPLLQFDNVVATPHLGYVTEANYRKIYGQVTDAIRAYQSGEAPVRPLNRLS